MCSTNKKACIIAVRWTGTYTFISIKDSANRNLGASEQRLDLLTYSFCDTFRIFASTQILGLDAPRHYVLNRLHECIGTLLLADPPNHLCCTPESSDRVCDAFPSNVWCRAMDGLEHGWIGSCGVKVARRRNTGTSRQCRSKIGQNISMQVGRHNSVYRFGMQNHAHGNGVNQHLLGRHLRIFFGNLVEDLVPEHHA